MFIHVRSLMGTRPAIPADLRACFVLRGRRRENAIAEAALAVRGITVDSWREAMDVGRIIGFVHERAGAIVGFCFGETDSGEILVLALPPDFEYQGIGGRLLASTVERLRSIGHHRLFLACNADPTSRSHGFYRHAGWTTTDAFDDAGDEILELKS